MRLFNRNPKWASIGGTYEDASRIVERKSQWMVEYLRARRSGDKLRAFYRQQHFIEKAQS